MHRRRIVLVQLPIPQSGMEPARGNVPLAAGYLALYARQLGLDADFEIEIFPAARAGRLGDRALVEALLERDPWMVGFTCYLWNVERSLWVAARLKERRPDVRILIGGPEVTPDNDWVLRSPQVDFAAIGEGEQTFAELLQALRADDLPASREIPGLWVSSPGALPPFRRPVGNLDAIGSPYLAGILDAREESMLLLETIRGCVFQCKFCYYPKSYDDLHFLSRERIEASLAHARERGVREVVLLDPTLNQGRDFAAFLRLLARGNPERRFSYFGELRAEGIDDRIAALLREANFTEVEIGLQSIDPGAQRLMDRRNNLRAFERGVRALLGAGIRVKIDLIVGLPGDTPESVRRGMQWVRDTGLYSDVQMFELAVLPGTAFRHEAAQLGLEFQPRPPYFVLRTPSMGVGDFHQLMAEAEDLFDAEFDELPPPRLPDRREGGACWEVHLDADPAGERTRPAPGSRAQAFTLWLRAHDLAPHRAACARLVAEVLRDNPFTTLQVVLEPGAGAPDPGFLEALRAACYAETTYLDRYLSVLPGPMKGSKRIVLLLPAVARASLAEHRLASLAEHACIVWRGRPAADGELLEHEYVLEASRP